MQRTKLQFIFKKKNLNKKFLKNSTKIQEKLIWNEVPLNSETGWSWQQPNLLHFLDTPYPSYTIPCTLRNYKKIISIFYFNSYAIYWSIIIPGKNGIFVKLLNFICSMSDYFTAPLTHNCPSLLLFSFTTTYYIVNWILLPFWSLSQLYSFVYVNKKSLKSAIRLLSSKINRPFSYGTISQEANYFIALG